MSTQPTDWIRPAHAADAELLAQLIALSFAPLACSQWLVPNPAHRRAIFPDYFRIHVEHALKHGHVWTTQSYDGVALWMHVSAGGPPPQPDEDQLTAATGKYAHRFQHLDRLLTGRHPTDREHHHLAMLAVNPRRQRHGVGSALLEEHHRVLDRTSTAAYLEASDTGTRQFYLRHGYADAGEPIEFCDGIAMYPMIREPHTTP
jgi:GNAT superfamily N-acetyltransferase